MPTDHPLHTWDAAKQARWQQGQRQQQLILHVLLDASGSMTPYAGSLRASYNMYLDFLQHSASPTAIMDTRCFGAHLQPRPDAPPLHTWDGLPIAPVEAVALSRARPLTADSYQPVYGGTALYDAVGTIATTSVSDGQHVLILYTDGALASCHKRHPTRLLGTCQACDAL